MAVVRCSRCGKAFERTPHIEQVCPNCGLRAPLVPPTDPIMPDGVVGKPRRAVLVFLLALIQPIFWPMYLLMTFRPLDKQHGRFHPMAWWIGAALPAIGILTGITYAWIGLVRLQRSRRARGLRSGIGPFWYLVVLLAGPVAAVGYTVYFVMEQEGGLASGESWTAFVQDPLALSIAIGAWVVTPALALALAVASANGLWRMIYDEKGEAWPWRESAVAA